MKWLTDLKLSTRLGFSFLIMIVFIAIIGLTGYWGLNTIGGDMDEIFEVRLPSLDKLLEADRDLYQLLVAERSMIFANSKSDAFAEMLREYEENMTQSEERIKKYMQLDITETERQLLSKYQKAREEWLTISKRIVDGRIADTRAGRRLALDLSLGAAKEKFSIMRSFLDQLTEISLESVAEAHHRSKPVFKKLVGSFLVTNLIGILTAIILVFRLNRSIVKPINHIFTATEDLKNGDLTINFTERNDEIGRMGAALNEVIRGLNDRAIAAAKIADGDLNQKITVSSSKDTLGNALQKIVNNLNDIMGNLKSSMDQVEAGSQQVSDSSQSLSQGATEQAASLQEITSSMTEIGDQTKTNAQNATQANQLVSNVRETGRSGEMQMAEMVTAMEAISESSREISKIMKTIDDIAFQTNLLALNAAVEAARAGKHGKGFAVVAQEVRALASRSAKAAQETADLIEGSVKRIEDGSRIAEKTAAALGEINDGVTKAADLVGEIAAASNEQAQGISQVNQGLEQIDSVTQQNTANAEQTSSAAEELYSQAVQIKKMLTQFKLLSHEQHLSAKSFKHKNSETQQKPSEEHHVKRVPSLPAPSAEAPVEIDGWGSDYSSEKTPFQKPLKPEDIISLDDDEFGKY